MPTPIHSYATEHGIPCYQPESAKTEAAQEEIAAAKPDFIVTAAYGQILPEALLELPKFRAVNVHASLLPRYRGASPVHWSIINGDKETGVTIMEMIKAMDAGGIFRQKSTPIEADETADALMDRLAILGAAILPDCLIDIAEGNLQPVPQDESKASYVARLSRDTGVINWQDSPQAIHNLVRGTYPWPGASTYNDGKRVKIHRTRLVSTDDMPQDYEVTPAAPGELVYQNKRLFIACGAANVTSDVLEILEIQMPGGKRLTAEQCAHNLPLDLQFGGPDAKT